jgi:uncharacterized damage-inducible protein DinB
MSHLTNPAGRSREEAAAYIRALHELLGDRDPFAVLQRTPGELSELVRLLPESSMDVPEAPGKWSIRHVIRHLADSELVWAYRLRLILGQVRPRLDGYDQDAWAGNLGYEEAPLEEAVQEFTVVRRGNLRLLHRASEAELARVGIHGERGEESLAQMIPLYAGHDLAHLGQIQRIRSAVTG